MQDTLEITKKSSPAEMILMAMDGGTPDLDKLGKLLELQERWEKNEAKKAYHKAMSAFKTDPPEIDKDKTVSFETTKGTTGYRHASLANVTKKINSVLSKHGLSAAWSMQQTNGSVTVTCTITHEQGHSESTSLTASPDTSGSKNSIQAIGSVITYLERYTILALTGLAAHDTDDDGMGAVEYIDEKQLSTIRDFMSALEFGEIEKTKFYLYMGVENEEKILTKDFGKAVASLQAKQKQKVKK